MQDRKKLFLDNFFRKKIAEVDVKRALSKANIKFSEEDVTQIKDEISKVLLDQKEIYSEEKLKSRRIDEIGLSAFNFASVLYAVEKIEERRGPSPFLTAIKKQAKKHRRLYELIQL
ncbi:MAG: hypothetical protein VKK32_00850 [Candidatus Melainabacteria bacterium]|jgi:hypothetical protein|nr:hypothetical protein [Candidatus Melainabacteria bacterium]